MDRSKKVFVIILGLVILTCGFFLAREIINPKVVSMNPSSKPPVNITLSNFAEMVSKNAMIQNLPEDALIELVFYEGDREKSFLLERASVAEGSSDEADLEISMPLRYLDLLTDRNFCQVIQKADNEGFLFVSTEMTTTSLLWKYKSMIDYRDCLGF